jgi:hypothetical protein
LSKNGQSAENLQSLHPLALRHHRFLDRGGLPRVQTLKRKLAQKLQLNWLHSNRPSVNHSGGHRRRRRGCGGRHALADGHGRRVATNSLFNSACLLYVIRKKIIRWSWETTKLPLYRAYLGLLNLGEGRGSLYERNKTTQSLLGGPACH